MAVVTIARQYGAGARLVGEMVAERLGYELIDQEMLDIVAHKAGVTVKKIREIEKLAGDSLLTLVSEIISTASITRHVPGIATEFDEDSYRLFLKRVITELAVREKAVIIGRGGQLILRDHPKAVRVYLMAEESDRVKYLMVRYGVSRSRAESVARKEERKRLNFLRGFEMGDPEDLLMYHAVINMSRVDYDVAAGLIAKMALEVDEQFHD